jgi:mediator of RNA polymerase II transcription subunit 17, fungi type
VRVQVGGTETGSSPLPQPAAEDALIEALILQARNTIFSEELWHELNRETRTLGAFGVRSEDDTLIWPVSDTRNIILDLVPLSDSDQNISTSGPDNTLAEGILLSLNLLLSYAHRQNHHRRTQPPPPISSEKRRQLPYGLLRPLLNRLQHQEALLQIRHLFRTLCQVLKSASVTPEPSYSMTQTIFPNNNVPIPEYTLSSLTDHPEVVATWILSDDTSITVRAQTIILPDDTLINVRAQTIILANQTTYVLTLSPSSPLYSICPAPSSLSSFDALREYILYATSCFLASTFSEPQTEDEDAEGWVQTIQQNILRKRFAKEKKSRQMSISLLPVAAKAKLGIRMKVMWEWMKGDTSGFRLKTGDEIGVEGKGNGIHQWVSWEGGDEGEVVVVERSLRDVVESAGK